MKKSFAEALDDLVNAYLEAGTTRDVIISDIELKKMALEEEEDVNE